MIVHSFIPQVKCFHQFMLSVYCCVLFMWKQVIVYSCSQTIRQDDLGQSPHLIIFVNKLLMQIE